jgi:hypothetical protein
MTQARRQQQARTLLWSRVAAIDHEQRAVGVSNCGTAGRPYQFLHPARVLATQRDQLDGPAVLRQTALHAAVHRDGLGFEVGITSPPPCEAAIKLGPYAAIAVGEPPRRSCQPDADAASSASRSEDFGRVKLTSHRELTSLASVTDGSKR